MFCKPRQFVWNVHTQTSGNLRVSEACLCVWLELESIHMNMYISVAKLPVAYHSKLLRILLPTKHKNMSGRVGVNELPVGFIGLIGCFVRNSAYHSTNLIGQFVACTIPLQVCRYETWRHATTCRTSAQVSVQINKHSSHWIGSSCTCFCTGQTILVLNPSFVVVVLLLYTVLPIRKTIHCLPKR